MLVADEPLAKRYHDHSLVGEWKDHRDCHIKPDLVLIYRKTDEGTLDLVRPGSHSELGLWANAAFSLPADRPLIGLLIAGDY